MAQTSRVRHGGRRTSLTSPNRRRALRCTQPSRPPPPSSPQHARSLHGHHDTDRYVATAPGGPTQPSRIATAFVPTADIATTAPYDGFGVLFSSFHQPSPDANHPSAFPETPGKINGKECRVRELRLRPPSGPNPSSPQTIERPASQKWPFANRRNTIPVPGLGEVVPTSMVLNASIVPERHGIWFPAKAHLKHHTISNMVKQET